jgi:hypothetical protein
MKNTIGLPMLRLMAPAFLKSMSFGEWRCSNFISHKPSAVERNRIV